MKSSRTLKVQLGQRGVLVLPKEIRDSYRLQPGDSLSVIDLGGALVLSPERSEVDGLSDRLSRALLERGETLESMLKALREERDRLAGEP